MFSTENAVWLHAFQDAVEVVRIHFHEFPVLQLGQRTFGLTREITRTPITMEFLELDRVAHFHVVGDVHARRAHPVEFMFVLCFAIAIPF